MRGQSVLTCSTQTDLMHVGFMNMHVSDHTEPAFVTHIRNPCHFVVQLNRNIDRLTELSHTINHYCKTMAGKNDIPQRVEPGIG